MNLTTTVMMILVFFLLCSGIFQFTFASNLRIFNHTSEDKNWTEAQHECNETGGSLVTLYDDEDATFMQKYMTKSSSWFVSSVWLGLTKTRTNVTTWSNGAPFIFNRSSVNINDGQQICEAMDKNTWKGFTCSGKHYFMCYKDNQYVLIEKKKDWCQAELYCRQHYSNLVSISDEEQNQKVIKEGKNKTFWIGLLHDEWEWVDKTCSTYRTWSDLSDSAGTEAKCTVHVQYLFPKPIKPHECFQGATTFCSTGDTRIRVINRTATWEEALDYCEENYISLLWIKDVNDQEAVKQWLEVSGYTGTFWIGLRQSIMFGFWIWKDSPVLESNWKDDKAPEMPFSNQCGVINATDNKWSDENCFNEHPFICAEKILKY
uniref:C-type lectin domain-containing protein n=1 Tax=Amphiprion percula TaxID=161767 RepID=A0A3P8TN60_AMPPE